MTLKRLFACIMFLTVFAASSAMAQGINPGGIGDGVEGFFNQQDEQEKAERMSLPDFVPDAYLDEESRAAMRSSLIEYYRYHENGYKHRRQVFEWQLLSSRIIFGLVVLIVAIGLYFSWLQFMSSDVVKPRSDEKDSKDQKAEPEEKGKSDATTFEFSLKHVKVTSPVLGVVILTISLAFFYLYLVYIFPIKEIF